MWRTMWYSVHMRRDQRCKRTGNPVRCSGYQRKGVYAFQRNLQPPAGYVPPDGTMQREIERLKLAIDNARNGQ